MATQEQRIAALEAKLDGVDFDALASVLAAVETLSGRVDDLAAKLGPVMPYLSGLADGERVKVEIDGFKVEDFDQLKADHAALADRIAADEQARDELMTQAETINGELVEGFDWQAELAKLHRNLTYLANTTNTRLPG